MKEIQLSVSEPTDHGRRNWYVSSGVPFPKGELASEEQAFLADSSGEPVIAQLDTLTRWDDGSVKWLLVTFVTCTEAGTDRKFRLIYGEDVQPERYEPAFKIYRSSNEIRVSSDLLRFNIYEYKLNLLKEFWFNGEMLIDNGDNPAISMVNANGTILYPGASEVVTVEENGPVRTTIRVEGHYADSWDNKLFHFITRFQCFRDFPGVLVTHTIGNDNLDERMTNIHGLALTSRHKFAEDAQVYMGGQWLSANENASLLQYDDNRFTMDSPSPTSGERSKGIVTVKDGKHGFSAIMRDFWQAYPSGLSTSPSEININLLPELAPDQYDYIKDEDEKDTLYYWFDNGQYKLSRGAQISWDVMFFAHGSDDPYTENPDILADHFQNPILAVADPEVYCASGAIGDVDPQTEGIFDSYTRCVEEGFKDHEKRRREIREYGFMNYGDWYGERKYNWGNLEYDLQWCMALQFMRSGDPKYFWRGHQAALHSVHIDTILYDDRSSNIGRMRMHCLGHTGGYFPADYKGMSAGFAEGRPDNGHTFIQGNYAYYVLTGDRRFLEASEKTATQLAEYCTKDFNFGIERSGGWPLISIMAAYDFTGDQRYLEAARVFIQRILEKQDKERGVWLAPIWECHHEPKHYGSKPFATGILLKGMIMYDTAEPSDEVKQSIVRAAQGIVREMWSEKDKGFYYAGCPSFMEKAAPGRSTELIGPGLTYAFRYSGDEAIRKVLMDGLGFSIRQVNGFGKTYAQHICHTPYTLYDMRRWGLTELPMF